MRADSLSRLLPKMARDGLVEPCPPVPGSDQRFKPHRLTALGREVASRLAQRRRPEASRPVEAPPAETSAPFRPTSDDEIKDSAEDRVAWWRFLLERVGDPEGIGDLLLMELEESGTLSAQSRSLLLVVMQEAKSLGIDYTRTQLAYLRSVAKKQPCVVIDNVDQLKTEDLVELTKLAELLAQGTKAGEEDNAAGVLLALRPISLGNLPAGTGFVKIGDLRPPVIRDVLDRRLESFLDEFRGRITRGSFLSDDRDGGSKQVTLEDALGEVIDLDDPDVAVRKLLVELTRAMTEASTPYGAQLGGLLHELTNGNTRLSLLATTQYVASGHHDWRGLLDLISEKRRPSEVLSYRKSLMALILGVHRIFNTRTSWMCNMFSDASSDAIGVMIRTRILRAVDSVSGLSVEDLVRSLGGMFGYPGDRVRAACANLKEIGLLEEPNPGHLKLTRGGKGYLEKMIGEFEYLQHVLVDSCVSPELLVRCERDDELADRRFERVAKYADWIRQLEVEELATAITRQQEASYERYYGGELISQRIVQSLAGSLDRLKHIESRDNAWARLGPMFDAIKERARFESVRADARTRAMRDLKRLAATLEVEAESEA